jgi:hypothetical protein
MAKYQVKLASKVDVGFIYFPRPETLRETDGYGSKWPQPYTVGSIFRKQGKPSSMARWECEEETLPHDWI